MKLNNIKQILLTAADISMVILNISLAPLKRSSDFIQPARPFTTSFASRLRRPGRIHEDLLKVFLNPQPGCKNLLQMWLLALSFYL